MHCRDLAGAQRRLGFGVGSADSGKQFLADRTLLRVKIDFRVALNIDIQVKGELNGGIKGEKARSVGINTGQTNVIGIFLGDGATDRRDVRVSSSIVRCSKNGGGHG